PSTRLSASQDSLASVSEQRQMEPAQLTRLVRGELDWIVMKALEKDRSRRYETASGFALDIERYLRGEPVLAGPPAAAYRVRKFGRRHKGGVAAAAAMLGLVLAGAAVSTWQAVRATRAARAEEAAKGQARQALDTLTDEVVETLLARQP